MTKREFLSRLAEGLAGLPRDEAEERLAFYGESIDDRMEDGLSEEEAVAAVGTVEEIVAQTLDGIPLPKLVRERVRPKRRLRAWEIVLLAIGSPLWLALGIAAAAILFAVYVVLWALIVALWAVDGSFFASAAAGVINGIQRIVEGDLIQGLCWLGAGVLLAGLGLFLTDGCVAASRGAARLTAGIARGIKSLFVRKETAA